MVAAALAEAELRGERLVASIIHLRDAFRAYGLPPAEYDADTDGASAFFPTIEDFNRLRALHARVVGLTAACELAKPPALEDAGLPVYSRVMIDGQNWGYRAYRFSSSEAREEWLAKLNDLHIAAQELSVCQERNAIVSREPIFEDKTQSVTLNGTRHKVSDPKAYLVYKAVAEECPKPITQATIKGQVRGCEGKNKIRRLLDSLPDSLRDTVQSGSSGYWLDLNPPPSAHQRRCRK